jgi:UDP-glucose 4-epimerase
MKRSERILITGGAGFIGSHLADALLGGGASVTVVDNLSTGKWANIDHLQEHANFRAIIASCEDRGLIEQEVAQCDAVYHLASAVGVKLIIERPVETVETIFHGTDVVFKAASKFRKPVLLTSTSEVYGKSEAIPFKEDADVVMGPTSKRRWAYACAKALDEFLALAHYYQTHLPVYIVRLFNTVGPRQTAQYGMVLPTFVRQALKGDPITIYGDGTQRRCFCSVLDVVDALKRLPFTPAAAGKVVNVGSQEEVSIRELAERIKARTHSQSEIRTISYDAAYGPGFDDMMRRVPDLTRVNQLIDWKPRHDLNAIIDQVTDYVKKELQRA